MIRSRMLVVTLVAVFMAAAAWGADTPGNWSDGLPRALPEEVGLHVGSLSGEGDGLGLPYGTEFKNLVFQAIVD